MKYEESPGSCNFEGFCFFRYKYFNSFFACEHYIICDFSSQYTLYTFKMFSPPSSAMQTKHFILNRVRFGNEVSIQQCVFFHVDLTSPQFRPYSFFN